MDTNGKRSRKYLFRGIGVAILLATILGVNYIASLCFGQVRVADYYKYDLNRLQQENTAVDLVIVGASHVYSGCNPDVISEEMGIGEVIDCSFAVGYADGEYYMLKDTLNRFTPKYVVIDLPWHRFQENRDPAAKLGKYLSTDRMEWRGRLDYALHCFDFVDWVNLLCPMYRYGDSVWGFGQLKRNYTSRKAVEAGHWAEESKRAYRKNGYLWSARSCPQGSIPVQESSYSQDRFSEYNVRYVRKMCKLCQEKGIPVVLVTIPTTLEDIYGTENYQASPDYMESFAEELGCPYLNFNLLRDREEIFPDPMFKDRLHLSGEGSVIFSRIFAGAVQMALNGENTDDLFYKNVEELQKDVHRIVASNGRAVPDGNGTLTVEAKSLQNEDVTPEYRLVLIDAKEAAAGAAPAGSDEEGSDAADGAGAEDVGVEGAVGSAAEDDSSAVDAAPESQDGQEIRPWQEETTFTVSESEIPKGYVLRLEVRQKGQTEAEAYTNGLTEEFQISKDM